LALITQQADLTLEEMRERVAERGFQLAVSSIWRFYDRHGISTKKKCVPRSSSARMWRARGTDETGTTTNMARARGRCRRGARLIGRVPHGHWKTITPKSCARGASAGSLPAGRDTPGRPTRGFRCCATVATAIVVSWTRSERADAFLA
jgi:hypothetical protein